MLPQDGSCESLKGQIFASAMGRRTAGGRTFRTAALSQKRNILSADIRTRVTSTDQYKSFNKWHISNINNHPCIHVYTYTRIHVYEYTHSTINVYFLFRL